MSEVTAEMIARGRFAEAGARERRRMAGRMREARERLTSSGAGNVRFDVELLRLYARSRRAAILPQGLLSIAVGVMTARWLPLTLVGAWLALVLSTLTLGWVLALRFLGLDKTAQNPRQWRSRFVLAAAADGFAWATFALLMSGVDTPWAIAYVMVVFMLAGAIHTVVAAFVPEAVYAALAPNALAIVLYMRPTVLNSPNAALTLLSCATLLYFAALARRIYAGQVGTLGIQAEKDSLIAELEQAKANSDEARRRAEEASLAKSRFLATMSHELRTPLNAILGFSEVMKSELFGPHSVEAYRDYSNDIHASGQHLLMLINEILDLSRVEAGRYELKEEAVLLSGVIEDCRHLLTLRAKKRGVLLTEIIEPDMPRLWADERAVRQIALNLLTNAIKFTPQGGQVTIKAGWTMAGGQYFSVRDTGPGIPEEEIPVIMSSFGRGSMAQKNADEGTGLGLPIVKGLVELHGGTFTLRSKLREGTEVIVVFPPERVMAALPQLDPVAPPAARRRGAA
ncbi:HAMP domain-containing histidine kinase [Rhodoblastus acidophilus]|uniref:histidine kinase n=1 Tax=Candidatus Rhodoblastus alkanivorans TaxID=2954117 RepID=A0ABS9ZAN9_9HYPH|nr:HAMP domain-containing sensor histidine kinase [Candidatus Rhodoblastus alkanivorans]MCI4677793.1 HAMP domain-containing histidine kinase [Candidatus Rhodoblastus alkanivorans]MCI4684709.1 HAMP domain-containing histidine kinase [Candidatus Rhodoblastus alkanivorans]MDI4642031.1 HAMP domain-containing histidine kinase [Rhodoblastus acidophilus]